MSTGEVQVLAPKMILVPQETTTNIDLISAANCISGCLVYNTITHKLEFYNGTGIETVTSTAR